MRVPSDCTSMTELRHEIDRLDRALIDLLVQRAEYIDRAIEVKTDAGLSARISERVAEVLHNVRKAAEAQGLDPDLAEALWSQIIEWSIAREERVLVPGDKGKTE